MVRACHGCKVYMVVYPNNLISKELEAIFNIKHSKHTIQTIAWNEITKEYKYVRNLDNDK